MRASTKAAEKLYTAPYPCHLFYLSELVMRVQSLFFMLFTAAAGAAFSLPEMLRLHNRLRARGATAREELQAQWLMLKMCSATCILQLLGVISPREIYYTNHSHEYIKKCVASVMSTLPASFQELGVNIGASVDALPDHGNMDHWRDELERELGAMRTIEPLQIGARMGSLQYPAWESYAVAFQLLILHHYGPRTLQAVMQNRPAPGPQAEADESSGWASIRRMREDFRVVGRACSRVSSLFSFLIDRTRAFHATYFSLLTQTRTKMLNEHIYTLEEIQAYVGDHHEDVQGALLETALLRMASQMRVEGENLHIDGNSDFELSPQSNPFDIYPQLYQLTQLVHGLSQAQMTHLEAALLRKNADGASLPANSPEQTVYREIGKIRHEIIERRVLTSQANSNEFNYSLIFT